jgi:hypothetical protein
MVLWPVLSLEEWDIARPMARTVIPPPQGQILLPDVPNWTWHEYGMRVGFWRLKRMYERLGISPTVTLNAKVCETYPPVAGVRGWEPNAHSYEQILQRLDDERAVIAHARDREVPGRRPRGGSPDSPRPSTRSTTWPRRGSSTSATGCSTTSR